METVKVLAIIGIVLSTTAITLAIMTGSTNPLTYSINIVSIALSTFTLYNVNRTKKDFK